MVLLLVPMLLLVLSTQHFFDRQIQENERNYLQVAMKTVRNDMENRMDEMRKAGLLFAGVLGIGYGTFSLMDFAKSSYEGFTSMTEIFLLSLLSQPHTIPKE